MEQPFIDLCEKYGLTCLSVMFFFDRVTVYPHWDDDRGADCCVSGNGQTFEQAFDDAIALMADVRKETASA